VTPQPMRRRRELRACVSPSATQIELLAVDIDSLIGQDHVARMAGPMWPGSIVSEP